MVSARDLILATLAWGAETGSDGQIRDVVAMIEITGVDLDRAYVERWAMELRVLEAWHEVDRGGSSR